MFFHFTCSFEAVRAGSKDQFCVKVTQISSEPLDIVRRTDDRTEILTLENCRRHFNVTRRRIAKPAEPGSSTPTAPTPARGRTTSDRRVDPDSEKFVFVVTLFAAQQVDGNATSGQEHHGPGA